MKQYNIPDGGYVPVDNIIYFMESDISQINRIPLLQNYDDYAIVTAGPIYLDKDITAHDVAMLMLLLKVARTKSPNPTKDTYIDMVGYSAIAGELADDKSK